jgi:hypothetical protein
LPLIENSEQAPPKLEFEEMQNENDEKSLEIF